MAVHTGTGVARRAFATLAGLAAFLAMAATASAQEEPADDEPDGDTVPKWEIGIGAGGGWTPHYPAAGQGSSLIAAAPFFIYRWESVRIGEGGLVSGRIFDSDRLDLTLSIGGSLPASSEDNRAREGMPDLDGLAEIGGQLEVTLTERPGIDSLKLKLPLRAVVSSDFSRVDYRGMVFKPRLSYAREDLFDSDLRGSVSLGPIFGSELLMDYFYDVPTAFVTADRPAYEADGGYLGTALSAGVSYAVTDRVKLFAGGQAGYYGGARNRNSPLFRDATTYSAGVGLSWKMWVSKRRVKK